ncbi:MAG: Smr/MutS family protein [Flavobacteriales bacterium]
MELRRGERVKFLNDEGEGIVVAFPRKGWILVEDRDGFTYEHPEEELVPVGNWNKEYDKYETTQPDIIDVVERNLDPNVARKANAQFKLLYKNKEATNVRRKGESMEVDLHIHELLDKHNHLSNGEIVQVQLEHFERTLRLAEEKKIPRIVFIHGVGQGILRAEIRKILHNYYPHCTFMDGPYNEYGFGATEVRISQSRQ